MINLYVSKTYEVKLIDLQRQRDKLIIIVKEYNTPISVIDTAGRERKSVRIKKKNLNYTVFLSVCGTPI